MKLSIAIPDSSLKDEKKHENKTRKIFQIARAAGIFQINRYNNLQRWTRI